MNKKILDDIRRFLQLKSEIRFAYILGSFLTEDDFHDIDIAVYLDHWFLDRIDTLEYETTLSLELEDQIKPGEIFNRLVAMDVKIINLDYSHVSFRYSASKGVLLFSRDEIAREEFLCRTWKEYSDFQYISDQYFQEVTNAAV